MEPRLIVVDEHRRGDMHGVDQTNAFHHAAPVSEFLDLRRDVDEATSIRYFEPKMFSERFHIREVEVGSSGDQHYVESVKLRGSRAPLRS